MKVLISLPIYKRDWILPLWLEKIEQQDIGLENIGFSFQVAPYSEDKETHDILLDWFSNHPQVSCFILNSVNRIKHSHHIDGRRTWLPSEYNKMCLMRNALLDTAKAIEPDFLFSLDSDILLEDETTISSLVELTEPSTAVSPLMYMKHAGVDYPSVMTWRDAVGKSARRANYPIGTFFQADVIMAAVMMSKEVYSLSRYLPHRQGEDVGWAADCAMKGFSLFSASHIYCPHIMHKTMANARNIKGPGILEYYLREGDDRKPRVLF